VAIVVPDTGTLKYGDSVVLTAETSDPDGQFVRPQWRAYACTDGTVSADGSHDGCDAAPWTTSYVDTFPLTIPYARTDQPTAVKAVLVFLEGTDSLGATAAVQHMVLELDNRLTVDVIPTFYSTYHDVDVPFDVHATVTDPDTNLFPLPAPVWTVPATFDIADGSDANTKHLTPHASGTTWTVSASATDTLGVVGSFDLVIPINPDQPPALGQLAPAVQPGDTFPLTEATLFEVLVVDDDLDPYPTTQRYQGTATFAWSLLPPGATTRQPLTTVTGNHVLLDPASYTPGDVIELRVEIQDRQKIPVNCPDSDATCSVTPDTNRIQRQTWRVEVQ
jgi:hypothetical protein